MKNKNLFVYIIGSLLFFYLTYDICHYLVYRVNPIYPEFTEAFYESKYISFFKWGLIVVNIFGLSLWIKKITYSYYLISFGVIGIMMLFFLKGSFANIIKGSFVFNIALLEICAFLLLFYINKCLPKEFDLMAKHRMLGNIIFIIFYTLVIKQLSPV